MEGPEVHRIAKADAGRGADAASSAGARVSSSCGSTATSLTENEWKCAAEAEFEHALLDYYLWLPGTATVVSRHIEHVRERCSGEVFPWK